MSQIPATEDLDPFFVDGELAQVITWAGGTFTAIVTDFYQTLDGGSVGAEGAALVVIAKAADVDLIDSGEVLTIGGDDYEVVGIRTDNTGVTRFPMARI